MIMSLYKLCSILVPRRADVQLQIVHVSLFEDNDNFDQDIVRIIEFIIVNQQVQAAAIFEFFCVFF